MKGLNEAGDRLACAPLHRYRVNAVYVKQNKIYRALRANTWLPRQMTHLHLEAHTLQRYPLECQTFPDPGKYEKLLTKEN